MSSVAIKGSHRLVLNVESGRSLDEELGELTIIGGGTGLFP